MRCMRPIIFVLAILLVFPPVIQAQSILSQSFPNQKKYREEISLSYSQNQAPAYVEKNQIQKKIIQTVLISVFAYLLLFSLINIINKRVRNIKARHTCRKNTIYTINILLILGILLIWLQNFNSFTLVLGFASAGVALALQEVILSIAGWILILIRRPFEVGDRIEINDIKGDVIDIRLFQISLLEVGNWVHADQSTGRIVNIPNSFVFKTSNYNYNRGFDFIWNEIPILITFESDWQKARNIMMTIAKKHVEGLTNDVQKKIEIMKNRYMIYYGKLTPIVYINIKDSGVELTLRYLTEAKKRRSSKINCVMPFWKNSRKNLK